MDGHRACGVRLDPKETLALNGRCPVCGNRVTVGVAHRVEKLADHGEAVRPATAGEVASLPGDSGAGPELFALAEVPVEDIGRADSLLGEAVARLRACAVIRQAGYDGEYGVIRLFEESELDRFTKGDLLFDAPVRRRKRAPKPQAEQSAPVEAPSQPAPSVPAPSARQGVLATLDADQAAAAAMIEGPLTVIGGPGSGKTRMLTRRIAHLVLECGVPAASCLAITFTRKATEELRARLAALLPGVAKDAAVHSFHSLGLAILRTHGTELGLGTDFRIADEKERTAALVAALQISESRATRLVKAVSVMKRTGAIDEGEEGGARAVLDRLGREGNWVDFDDLVALSVALLEERAEIAALWRERFTHILADEFQDVDEQQYRLLQLLAGPGGNLCVIGDPNQAIYGFRGADATCFARFAGDFPDARTARLKHNYRSTGTIVTAATQLMDEAPDGMTRPMEAPIVVRTAADEEAEAAFVAATIEAFLGGHDMLAAHGGKPDRQGDTPLSFADFAVLCRTDAQSAAFREAFDRAGIPFKKSSPAPIAGHAGLGAMLRALERQSDAEAGRDLPGRLAAAAEAARREEDADAAALAEARGWLTTLATSESVGGDVALLAEQIALSTEADFRDARADRVSLLTMHAAKGLEFPVVFVVGMEDGLVPFSWAPSAEQDVHSRAEERRLFYVAMTRAMDWLFLTRTAERFWRGAVRSLPPSPFLGDIADTLTASHTAAKRKPRARQLSLF
ncbi:UvrD-helicase domain-containing protein [Chelativorans salis]|uniref:DNA 3'-5' helicase n=1 Tax=Chelativorans salis TaxID=2978478 RepID=A0ABT2LNR9_9HYPH|nr:UvrD-helicase domain-containing protein [Chelativorans sp. EGI FJ00035]MCT7376097.1 UvrD-helicase domain-containing protein [Chelativorans sp. EGI FJ00035]